MQLTDIIQICETTSIGEDFIQTIAHAFCNLGNISYLFC